MNIATILLLKEQLHMLRYEMKANSDFDSGISFVICVFDVENRSCFCSNTENTPVHFSSFGL